VNVYSGTALQHGQMSFYKKQFTKDRHQGESAGSQDDGNCWRWLKTEGNNSPADVLVLVDAARCSGPRIGNLSSRSTPNL